MGGSSFSSFASKPVEKGKSSFQAEHIAPLAQRNGEIAEKLECQGLPKDCSRRSGEGVFKTIV